MQLSPRGIYRWYATCCRTPIGNTPRDPNMPYVGLVRTCLAAPPETLARHLGRSPIVVQTASARSPVKSTPLRTAFAVAKIGSMLLGARIGGSYRSNPSFQPGGKAPMRMPRVLTREERAPLVR